MEGDERKYREYMRIWELQKKEVKPMWGLGVEYWKKIVKSSLISDLIKVILYISYNSSFRKIDKNNIMFFTV